jgi:fused signal recognition particle receptor
MPLEFLKKSFEKVQQALAKTKQFFISRLRSFFSGPIDLEMLDELEQILYEADLGVDLSKELTEKTRQRLRANPAATSASLLESLQKDLLALFPEKPKPKSVPHPPLIILIVGINGSGKTTTCAKLAKLYQAQGQNPLIGAADTFRAAATEQLAIWAERTKVSLVTGQPKSDPASIAFDTLHAAKARGHEVAIIDTAGRLHTKTALMQELEKVRRACHKAVPGAPHETYLVVDASIGQNAIEQAKTFASFTPLSGLIVTKLDGTAKGGMLLSIQKQLGIPVKYLGVGEGIDDLEPFDPDAFVSSLFAK